MRLGIFLLCFLCSLLKYVYIGLFSAMLEMKLRIFVKLLKVQVHQSALHFPIHPTPISTICVYERNFIYHSMILSATQIFLYFEWLGGGILSIGLFVCLSSTLTFAIAFEQ